MSTDVLAPGCHLWMNGALVFKQARVAVESRCPAQPSYLFFTRWPCRFENELAGEPHCSCCQRYLSLHPAYKMCAQVFDLQSLDQSTFHI